MEDTHLPNFNQYRLKGLIQYDCRTRHFRALRIYGEIGCILDNLNSQIVEGYENINREIMADGWSPYILLYGRKNVEKDLVFM